MKKKQDERKSFIKPREQLIKTTLNDPGKVLVLGSKKYKEMRDKSKLLSKAFPVWCEQVGAFCFNRVNIKRRFHLRLWVNVDNSQSRLKVSLTKPHVDAVAGETRGETGPHVVRGWGREHQLQRWNCVMCLYWWGHWVKILSLWWKQWIICLIVGEQPVQWFFSVLS